jgi:hypothetical protein
MKNPTTMQEFQDGEVLKTHAHKTFEYPASLLE